MESGDLPGIGNTSNRCRYRITPSFVGQPARVCLGLSLSLIGKLKPYLGLRRNDALQALSARPLRLSPAEARELSAAIAFDIIARVARRFEAAANRRFADVPAPARTVIASVAYQYGDNLPKACPRFWRLVVGQDWQAVIE